MSIVLWYYTVLVHHVVEVGLMSMYYMYGTIVYLFTMYLIILPPLQDDIDLID